METDRDIKKDMKESNLFDFSNFPTNIPRTDKDYYYSKDHKFVPGMFLIHYLLYIIIFYTLFILHHYFYTLFKVTSY
jgi:hypothetical protein